jgi:ABC-type glycerol-3-phosphate transport system substrate-binding protein
VRSARRSHIGRRAAITTVLAASLVLAACGSSSKPAAASSTSSTKTTSSSTKTVTIHWWTTGETPARITVIDNGFDKTHPHMKAVGEYIGKSDEEMPKLISALKTNTYPTVVDTQVPSDLPLLAESGKLVDLNGKMTSLTDALYPGIRKSLFYRGKQLGMALSGVGDILLFYNKADFKAAGISSPPKTWAQLVVDARKLTDPAQHRWGFYVPLGDAEWISYAWEPMLWANGGHFLNSTDTKAVFDSKAGVDALTTWVDLLRKYHAAPDRSFAVGGNFDGSPAFASNAVAMLIDGPWDLSTFEKAKIDFGVSEFPAGSKGSSTNIGIGVEALFKKPSDKEAVGLAFMKYMASPSIGAYLAATSGGLPSSPAQLKEPTLEKAIASNPYYHAFADNEATGHVRPITPAYNAVSQDLWTEINDALDGKISPSQALKTAAAEADRALKKYSSGS